MNTSSSEVIKNPKWNQWVKSFLNGASRRDRFLAVLAGLNAFILYLVTLAPSLSGGDSGELITTAVVGGVPHPPGYPLYSILARLFTLLPFGQEQAWKINLFSAVTSAISSAVLFYLIKKLTQSNFLSILGAALFTLHPLVFEYSVTAEVFSLNILFFLILNLLTFCLIDDQCFQFSLFKKFTFILGLSFSHHHTIVFFGLPFLILVGFINRKKLTKKQWLISSGYFLLGLFPYFYLIFASQTTRSVMSWGEISGLHSLINHILRKDYGTFSLLSKSAGISAKEFNLAIKLTCFSKIILSPLGYLLPLFSLFVFFIRDQKQKILLFALLVSTLFYLVVFNLLANIDVNSALNLNILSRFWLLPLAALLILGISGLNYILRYLKFFERIKKYYYIQVLILSVVYCGLLFSRYQSLDHSKRIEIKTFGQNLLQGLPANSILLSIGDNNSNVAYYLQEVEKLRTDVVIVEQELLSYPWYVKHLRLKYPDLQFPFEHKYLRYGVAQQSNLESGIFSMSEFIGLNGVKRPIAVFVGFKEKEAPYLAEQFVTIPYSLGFLVLPKQMAGPDVLKKFAAKAYTELLSMNGFGLNRYADGTWERAAWNAYQSSLDYSKKILEYYH